MFGTFTDVQDVFYHLLNILGNGFMNKATELINEPIGKKL